MTNVLKYVFLAICVALLLWLVWPSSTFSPFYHTYWKPHSEYVQSLEKANSLRCELRETLDSAKTDFQRDTLYRHAGDQLLELFEKDFEPHWLGTSYNFYGDSKVPGRGKIACGFFVTNVLNQIGVKESVDSLARLASEKMIMALVSKESIYRYKGGTPAEVFFASVLKKGKGLYVVGLDTHTGFIVHDGTELYFVHASSRQFLGGVIRQKATDSKSLNKSKYRVIGKLSGDPFFTDLWLSNCKS